MELLEIRPRELKLKPEAKKHSSCTIHLANLSDQYVAFKVKTTSPKKYYVRPIISVVKPKSTCNITVTMPAQRSAPADLQCKDKFLIQSTVVPFGTTEENVQPEVFMKETGRYIEDHKLRVILASPRHSPVLLPVNGVLKQDLLNEVSMSKEQMLPGVENLPPQLMVAKRPEGLKPVPNLEEPKPAKVGNGELLPAKRAESSSDTDVKLSEDSMELKSKLRSLNSKLTKAQHIIAKLKDEKSIMNQDKERLKQELAMFRSKNVIRRVQVGFPPLFVCTVALIGLAIGSYLPAFFIKGKRVPFFC